MTYEDKKLKVGLRDVVEIIKLFDALSGRLNAFNIISRGVTVNISQGTYELDSGFEVRPNRPFTRVVKIPIFDALQVQLTSLPSLKAIDDAVIIDEDDGLILSLDTIPMEAETILLNIKCPLKHRRFLDRLIYTKVQTEPRKKITSYWMSAQFKHYDALRKKLSSLRIDDLDFFIQVHIQQNIKEVIPSQFIKQLEVGKELLQTRDRELKIRLAKEHLRLARGNNLVGKEEEVIQKIEDLLKPRNFGEYLHVLGQFNYSDCFQGASFFRIPNFVIPSAMRVITKTKLSLENPATKGELQYNSKQFKDDFENIFPRKMRSKK